MKFQILPYSTINKSIVVEGPYLTMEVDYDDVYHEEVAAATEIVVDLLNNHLTELEDRMSNARANFTDHENEDDEISAPNEDEYDILGEGDDDYAAVDYIGTNGDDGYSDDDEDDEPMTPGVKIVLNTTDEPEVIELMMVEVSEEIPWRVMHGYKLSREFAQSMRDSLTTYLETGQF